MILRILYCVFIFQVNVCCVSKRVVAENKEDTKVSSVVIPGHSHNDYEGREPLYEALRLGFKSIEVDVHLIGDELYVSHYRPLRLNPQKTLEKMYLEPLSKALLNRPLILLIDVKSDAVSIHQKLMSILPLYVKENLEFVISGNRNYDAILSEENDLVQIDGRPKDLAKGISTEKMPLISENYKKFFSSRNQLELKDSEVTDFSSFVETAHAEGKKIRLWASPDNEKMWQFLLDQGVDLVNTDKPIEFAEWYLVKELK